jgi:uncharacterized protein (DUF433 family)
LFVSTLKWGWGIFRPWKSLLSLIPPVCNGRPMVKGTRITVQTVMELLASGDTVVEVLAAYPSLNREQVLACMEWASPDWQSFRNRRTCVKGFLPDGNVPGELDFSPS